MSLNIIMSLLVEHSGLTESAIIFSFNSVMPKRWNELSFSDIEDRIFIEDFIDCVLDLKPRIVLKSLHWF